MYLKKIFTVSLALLCSSPAFGKTDIQDVASSHRLYAEERPWGSFSFLEDGVNYKVKLIVVLPGKSISLQTDNQCHKHWVIVEGNGLATVREDLIEVHANDYVYVPVKQLHCIQNTGEGLLVFIETQYEDFMTHYSDDRVD